MRLERNKQKCFFKVNQNRNNVTNEKTTILFGLDGIIEKYV